MISKDEFDKAAIQVKTNITSILPQMIAYKTLIQNEILNVATQQELHDVVSCRINEGMIDKMADIAHREWRKKGDAVSLYCVAMAVATIVKEYDWGVKYLVGDGLFVLATRIHDR